MSDRTKTIMRVEDPQQWRRARIQRLLNELNAVSKEIGRLQHERTHKLAELDALGWQSKRDIDKETSSVL